MSCSRISRTACWFLDWTISNFSRAFSAISDLGSIRSMHCQEARAFVVTQLYCALPYKGGLGCTAGRSPGIPRRCATLRCTAWRCKGGSLWFRQWMASLCRSLTGWTVEVVPRDGAVARAFFSELGKGNLPLSQSTHFANDTCDVTRSLFDETLNHEYFLQFFCHIK